LALGSLHSAHDAEFSALLVFDVDGVARVLGVAGSFIRFVRWGVRVSYLHQMSMVWPKFSIGRRAGKSPGLRKKARKSARRVVVLAVLRGSRYGIIDGGLPFSCSLRGWCET
jgi:hypothetical protein